MTIKPRAVTPTVSFPEAALAQHIGVVGKTGSGKSYMTRGVVELLLGMGRRVCIIDPTGVWWGLKSNADGDGPGFPVAIFGGDHADVPISVAAARPIAELIAGRNLPAVLDVSDFNMSERYDFVEHFLRALHATNRQPMHLVIDEADEFARQSPMPDQRMVLHEVDRIVRRGRIRGFRMIFITQRPAVLHKNVLTQANTLVAMRLPAPQDRKAIEEWIKGQGDERQGKAVMASLAGLQRGEGWIWAPEQDVLVKTLFPKIKTYDSMRAPEDGEEIEEPDNLADVDLSGIHEALAEAIDDVAADDPKVLKKRVADLERRLMEGAGSPAAEHQLREAETHGRRAGYRDALGVVGGAFATLQSNVDKLAGVLRDLERDMGPAAVPKVVNGAKPQPAASATPNAAVRSMLEVMVRYHPTRLTWSQVATLAGIKARGGHFNAARKFLVANNLVEVGGAHGNSRITATETGFASVGGKSDSVPQDRKALLDFWCSKLPSPANEILRFAVTHNGQPITDIAAQLGKAPRGGYWNSGMKLLRDNELLKVDENGHAWASTLLTVGVQA